VILRHTPVEHCPARWADLLDVKVPRSIRPNPERSPEGGSNINIIFDLLQQTTDVPGNIAECGVFRGSSLLAVGLFAKQHRLGKIVWGFDSFEGFDNTIEFDLKLGGSGNEDKKLGGFGNTSYETILEKAGTLGLDGIIQLNKGYFADSLPAHRDETFAFVHLDCDIYQSYKDCLEFFYPRCHPGSIILLDEYNDPPWPGCTLAVDEFLADKPERPIEIERDNYQKWYIRKQ
jgi:hypothetical protein